MPEPVQFYNRYTHEIETETIYGEDWLRWTYEKPLGRAALAALVKRAFFSKWYGSRMSRPESRKLIQPFIETLQRVDMREIPRPGDQQDVITKDNVVVTVNATIFTQVVDARQALFSIAAGLLYGTWVDGAHGIVVALGAIGLVALLAVVPYLRVRRTRLPVHLRGGHP